MLATGISIALFTSVFVAMALFLIFSLDSIYGPVTAAIVIVACIVIIIPGVKDGFFKSK